MSEPPPARRPEAGIGLLTLNRPEKLNALSDALVAEFQAALDGSRRIRRSAS